MKKNLVVALTLFGVSSLANLAFAKPVVSYTYGQLNYISESLDDYNCTQNGLVASGSFALTDELFAVASLGDVSGGGCGSSTLTAGAGYRIADIENVSLYTTLSLARTSIDAGGDDNGIILSAGGRSFVMPNIEARGALSYSTLSDGSLSLNGGMNYWLNAQTAITGDINWGSDSSSFAAGLRVNF